MFAPRLLYPDIFHDYAVTVPSCENSFPYFSIFDHSHNTWDASCSFECREDKYLFLVPPNLSSYISRKIEGETSRFSLYTLYDLSDHEDAAIHHLEFF